MKWVASVLQAGDVIRVPAGGIYHYGIYASDSEVIQFGLSPRLRHLDASKICVCATDLATFCCGQAVEVALPEGAEGLLRRKREDTLTSARNRLGETGYDILYNNCEHFVYECAFGRKYCSQTDGVRQKMRAIPFCEVFTSQTLSEREMLDFAPFRSLGIRQKQLKPCGNGLYEAENGFVALKRSGTKLFCAVSRHEVAFVQTEQGTALQGADVPRARWYRVENRNGTPECERAEEAEM